MMLEVSQELELGSTHFNQATVDRYLVAVEDEAMTRLNTAARKGWVPPLAVAAQFSAVVSQLQLPLEALHTAQELEFLAPLPVGSTATCHARVVARRERSDVALVHLEFEVRDAAATLVLRGKATLLLPKEAA